MSTTRTIRDAMKVAKNLGFTYLWVDALCIIQDPNQSKAPKILCVIHQIYENSSLTIVAASITSADRSFLKVRAVPKRKTFKIPYRLSQDQFPIISIQEHEQYDDLKEPVNKRARTLQEQLLSPRLLIYASHTLQWQCSTTTCNLGDSYHAPNLSAIPRLPAIAQRSEFARKIRNEGSRSTFAETVHPFLQHWMRIVISYSNRSVTLESDKLTALAGLATVFSPLLGPNYFAGLWEKSFLQQLCWQPASDTAFFSRPTSALLVVSVR